MFKSLHFIIVFIFILNPLSISASNYDSDTLSVFSKIMPRFILMSSIKEQLQEEIVLCIVSDDEDNKHADTLILKTKEHHSQGIKNYEIVFKRSSYENIQVCKNAHLAFLFDSSDKNIEKFILFSQKNSILTVSYSAQNLENGSDISLYIGRKVMPYLNTKSISNKNIILESILYRISKIYLEEDK